MANVRLAELTQQQQEQIDETTLPEAREEGGPDWAKALANSREAFERFVDERRERYEYFGAEEHAMVQFAAASLLETDAPCKAIALEKLRAQGWSDERIVNFAMLVATVRRNSMLTAALGLTDPIQGSDAFVELRDIEDRRFAKAFGEAPPTWAKALAHKPRLLERLVRERESDLGFNSEQWTMMQYVQAALFTGNRHCYAPALEKLRSFGWSDPKLVEFAAMISNLHRNSVLLSALGV